MGFKSWLNWVKSLPWGLRWFVILVLIRPLIDQMYLLKEISPFLSPLYWAGILTIIFSIIGIINYKSIISKSKPYKTFKFFTILYSITLILYFIFYSNFEFRLLASFLKWILIVFTFFFISRFIRNKKDFIGLCTTFLYSCLIVLILIIYFGNYQLRGLYDDVQNVAYYLCLGFLINNYLYLERLKTHNKKHWLFFLGLLIAILSLFTLKHIVTIFILAIITWLFLYHSQKISKPVLIASLTVLIIFFVFYGNELINYYLNPQLETELAAIQGEKDSSHLFHGRMSRWEFAVPAFFSQNIFAILFGNLFGDNLGYDLVYDIDIHNDFLRILFLTGVFGISIYFLFLYMIFKQTSYLLSSDKYIVRASLLILVLYSMTSYPTIYPMFIYVLSAVFIFSTYQYGIYLNEKHSDYK